MELPEPICPECLQELRYKGETADYNFGYYHCTGCKTQVVMQNIGSARKEGRNREKAASPISGKDKFGFPHQSTK